MDWQRIIKGIRECCGAKVLFFDSISSTQEVAVNLVKEGLDELTVVIARRQTKGRGRFYRKWYSPDGGLYFSVIIQPRLPVEKWPLYSLMAGLGVCRAIGKIKKERALKWPNDCLIAGQKVSGILSEAFPEHNKIVVGIGVNLVWRTPDVPLDLVNSATTLFDEFEQSVEDTAISVVCKSIEELNRHEIDILGLNEILNRAHILDFDGIRGRQKRVLEDGTLIVEGLDGREIHLGGGYVTGD